MSNAVTDSVKIANIKTKNRIAVPPMVMFHRTDDSGVVSDYHVKHYEEMAAGGAGLIIIEATAVTKRSRLSASNLGLWDDSQIEGFKRITDAIHKHGVPCFVQLLHAGVNGIDAEAETASDYQTKRGDSLTNGHAMTKERILETVQDFAAAAVRAKKAGCDGIELHGCHGYLFSQFNNVLVNKRTDEYNATDCKFYYDTLKAIREACGPDFAVGSRHGIFDPDLEAGIRNAKVIAPLCDFIDVSYGWWEGMKAEKPSDFPYKEAFYGAMMLKKELPDMPIFAVDGIRNADDVKGVLALTGIDMVAVGKGFLVNSGFGNAVINGTDTGKCLGCSNPACHWSPFMYTEEVNCPGRKLFERNNS